MVKFLMKSCKDVIKTFLMLNILPNAILGYVIPPCSIQYKVSCFQSILLIKAPSQEFAKNSKLCSQLTIYSSLTQWSYYNLWNRIYCWREILDQFFNRFMPVVERSPQAIFYLDIICIDQIWDNKWCHNIISYHPFFIFKLVY